MIESLRGIGKRISNKASPYILQLSTIGMLVVIWTIYFTTSPGTFSQWSIYRTLFQTIPFTIFLGLGLTYIISAGEIDLSFPYIMAFTAWVFTAIWSSTGSVVVAIIFAVFVGCAAESVNGLLITKVGVPSIVVTIAAMFFWRGATMVASQGSSISLYWAKSSILNKVLTKNLSHLPLQMVWALLASVIFWLILFRHKFGSHLLAIGDDKDSARSLGVDVDRVKIATFGLMGIMSAIAGITMNMVVLSFFPSMGEGYLLPVMAAVFIGGTSITGGEGTILGTVIGAVIIGSLDTGVVAMGLSGFWIDAIYGGIIAVVTAVQVGVFER